MKKLLFIILFFLVLINKPNALPLPVEVTADAVVLMNLDNGQVVYEKNPDKSEILASLTKMMTVYTVIQNKEDLNEVVTITNADIEALWDYTVVGLEENDRVTYLDLIYGAMLKSGADAARALAIHMSGSEDAFVNLMNQEAVKMGLRHTHFADSFGGDDNNISTAREMALFVKEATKNDLFKKVFGTYTYHMSNGIQVYNDTRNLARFYDYDPNIMTGNKPGFTTPAGLLLASTATIGGVNYALIVCKSTVNEIYSTHVLDSYKVYNYLLDHQIEQRTVIKKGTVLTTIKVLDGTISEYAVLSDKNITLELTPDEFDHLTYNYNVTKQLTPNDEVGENLGYMDILVNNEVIYTYNIYLQDKIYSYHEQSKKVLIMIIILAFIIIILLCTNLFNSKKHK